MKPLLLAATIALGVVGVAHANTLTITAPSAGINLTSWNPYVGEAGSFDTSFGSVSANGDVVHWANPQVTGSENAYVLLTPVLNPVFSPLNQRSHGADFTLTLDTPVYEASVLMFDVATANSVQFGIGKDTVTVLGSEMVAAGFGDELITFTSATPFDRVQVHDIETIGLPDTYARFQLGVGGGAAPEPSTWAMMLIGFVGLGYAARAKTWRA